SSDACPIGPVLLGEGLDAAGQAAGLTDITNEQYQLLSEQGVNGRQIKNSIRLAQALAKFRNVVTTLEHLQLTVKMQMDLTADTDETW
ncbi:hypothetical protein SARC_15938, partial [Sphaeroforma arctica JP610]